MTDAAYKRAYGKGYAAGSRGAWPEHMPPLPPHITVQRLMNAAQRLRDASDSLCALFMPDDEGIAELSAAVNSMDEAMSMVTQWLKEDRHLIEDFVDGNGVRWVSFAEAARILEVREREKTT